MTLLDIEHLNTTHHMKSPYLTKQGYCIDFGNTTTERFILTSQARKHPVYIYITYQRRLKILGKFLKRTLTKKTENIAFTTDNCLAESEKRGKKTVQKL